MKAHYFKTLLALLVSSSFLLSCNKEAMQLQNDATTSASKDATTTKSVNATSTTQTTSNTAAVTLLYVDLAVLDGVIKDGKLTFTVTNQGNTTSAACKAGITFRCNGGINTTLADIPSIPGASTIVTRQHISVPVPNLCVQSDILFTIKADVYNTVTEITETNNTFSGSWQYIYIY